MASAQAMTATRRLAPAGAAAAAAALASEPAEALRPPAADAGEVDSPLGGSWLEVETRR